jgi:hypothetical protein
MRRATILVGLAVFGLAGAGQPKVAPGPSEPDWIAILDAFYDLRMIEDLENPMRAAPEEAPGLFRKAGPGPVRFRPVMALGLETTTRGGWYLPSDDPSETVKRPLWSYTSKSGGHDLEAMRDLAPPLETGATTQFDPGDVPFGLWVGNDGLDDGGVFTQPGVVRAVNRRLAEQPYKAMIYRLRDKATGQAIPHAYLIGWEYSTNDDFQDVVCTVENVELVRAERIGDEP